MLSINYDGYDEKLINIVNKEVDEAYYENVLGISLRKDLNKDNLKIVFSPEHGASNIPVRETLKRAGYNVKVVENQTFPDGNFSNTKTPNPEEKAAYDGRIKERYFDVNSRYYAELCDFKSMFEYKNIRKNNEYLTLSLMYMKVLDELRKSAAIVFEADN